MFLGLYFWLFVIIKVSQSSPV